MKLKKAKLNAQPEAAHKKIFELLFQFPVEDEMPSYSCLVVTAWMAQYMPLPPDLAKMAKKKKKKWSNDVKYMAVLAWDALTGELQSCHMTKLSCFWHACFRQGYFLPSRPSWWVPTLVCVCVPLHVSGCNRQYLYAIRWLKVLATFTKNSTHLH